MEMSNDKFQVFLLDTQKYVENVEDNPDMLSQSDRSMILVCHLDNDVESDDSCIRSVSVTYKQIHFCNPWTKKNVFVYHQDCIKICVKTTYEINT